MLLKIIVEINVNTYELRYYNKQNYFMKTIF